MFPKKDFFGFFKHFMCDQRGHYLGCDSLDRQSWKSSRIDYGQGWNGFRHSSEFLAGGSCLSRFVLVLFRFVYRLSKIENLKENLPEREA